ncbi:DNA polymerase III subunit [Moraxella sp. Pampa]|uniref:DNA polymerase III subunit n=1 Tax=Moraxella sp. Pampa TaxID=3111978 RepID=UPI002B40BB09|nr:DNA polymerase III subunit [Moraxella sp. Pampa]
MNNHASKPSADLPYFSPLFAWQSQAWEQVVQQFYDDKLPHGLLAGGMAGIGKHAFVWRLAAWLLCTNKTKNGACGVCQSCHWLTAGTHPDLLVLPNESLPTAEIDEKTDKASSIKIDDIRALQEYGHIKGRGVRLIVLDGAERLTLGASNALLKTLEEPRAGVHLILISDNPTRLLPTIKSRVQTLPLRQIAYDVTLDFITQKLGDRQLASLCLDLADGAVLSAIKLPQAVWFDQRALWIKTWLALRNGQRQPIVASDYWQKMMAFTDFITLTRLMLVDVMRVGLGLDSRHTDIHVANLMQNQTLDLVRIEHFLTVLDDMVMAVGQNVQEKMAYDGMFYELAGL